VGTVPGGDIPRSDVDPIAHTFAGAALATAGLRRATPLATAALLIGSNIPDVDVFASLGGSFAALALRRGWTHGVLALAIWPFIVTGGLLLFDRWRRSRQAQGPPPHPGRLLIIAAIAVLGHPTLDWLNNYGLRWLMPFDGRWFYGDALFIVDPWVWLMLGGVVFLAHSETRGSQAAWMVFWVASSILLLTVPEPPARMVWSVGLLGLLLMRFWARPGPRRIELGARIALAGIASYMITAVSLNGPARAQVQRELDAAALGPIHDVMLGPIPADPLGAAVVAETATEYLLGHWHWLAEPRFLLDEETIVKRLHEPAVQAAMDHPEVRDFMIWARYPYAEIETGTNGELSVHFRDARYFDNRRLWGPSVQLKALD